MKAHKFTISIEFDSVTPLDAHAVIDATLRALNTREFGFVGRAFVRAAPVLTSTELGGTTKAMIN